MLVLIVSACLASSPTSCAEHRLAFVDATLTQCNAAALPIVAAWAGDHPALEVKAWRCALDGQEGDPT